MRVIAYTFKADFHCPACTRQAVERMVLDHQHPFAQGDIGQDEHGIEYDCTDDEGNLIHPVFSTDATNFCHCGDCHAEL